MVCYDNFHLFVQFHQFKITALEPFDRYPRALSASPHRTEGIGIASAASAKVHDQGCKGDLGDRIVWLQRDFVDQSLPFWTPNITQAGNHSNWKENFSVRIEHQITIRCQPAVGCLLDALTVSSR